MEISRDVLVQRGTIFQSLVSCAPLARCIPAVLRPILSAIVPLESYDLSLEFQAQDR